MAIAPGTYDITLQRRADYELPLTFKDSTDTAINLTGWTVAAQVWNADRSSKYSDFTVAYTSRTGGQVKISLTDTQTAALSLTSPAKYDVLLTNSAGLKEYYLEGTIYAEEGYTA